MVKRIALALAAATMVLSVASCGSSGGSDAGSKDTGTTTKSTSGGGGSSDCDKGSTKDGIIRSFCGGTATVSFTAGGTSGKITGGTCEESGGYFTVNAGTVVNPDFKGTKPDYAGFLLPPKDGAFSGTTVTATITYGGNSIVVRDVSGTHDSKGGSFSGTDMTRDGKVTVDFTC